MFFDCPILIAFKELQVCPLSSPRYSCFEPEPEPKPAFELHFSIFQSRFPIAFLYVILLYSPFGLARECKTHLTFESFTSYLTNSLSLTTALLLLAKLPDMAGDFADK